MYFERNAAPNETPATSPPPRRRPRIVPRLDGAQDAVERRSRGREQRRVGRREHESRSGEWKHAHDDRGADRDRRVAAAESPRDHDREQRRDPSRHDRPEANAHRRRAQKRRPEANEQRDSGRMIEVAGGETSRPLPVVGLVRERRAARRRRASRITAAALTIDTAVVQRASRRASDSFVTPPLFERIRRRRRTIAAINTIAHVHTIHITRSSAESIVSMRHATAGPASATDVGVVDSATRRSATRVASLRPLRSTSSMRRESESPVMPRQPGIRISVHPGAARP